MAKLVNEAKRAATVAMKAARLEKQTTIVDEIDDCFDTLMAGADKVKAAKQAADTMATEHGVNSGNTRIALFRRIAGTAHRGKWELSQIDAAIDVIKQRKANYAKITVAAFCNDVRRICDPEWCEHVGAMFDRAAEAFKADAATMTARYKRPYHYVMNTLLPVRDAKSGTLKRSLDIPATAQEAIDRTKSAAPPAPKAVKPMAVIADAIEALAALPDCAGLKSALASLRALSEASFTVNSAAAMTAQADEQAKARKGTAPSPMPAPAPAPATAPATIDASILEDLLRSPATVQQAMLQMLRK